MCTYLIDLTKYVMLPKAAVTKVHKLMQFNQSSALPEFAVYLVGSYEFITIMLLFVLLKFR